MLVSPSRALKWPPHGDLGQARREKIFFEFFGNILYNNNNNNNINNIYSAQFTNSFTQIFQ